MFSHGVCYILKLCLLAILSCSMVVWAECPPNSYSCKPLKSEKMAFSQKSTLANDREKTKVIGAQGVISNGVLYVSNQQINVNSDNMVDSDNARGAVIIEGGKDIRKIVVSDLHIDARNVRSSTNKSSHALLVIDAPKNVDVEYVNSTINTSNVRLTTITNSHATTGGVNIHQNGNGNKANVKGEKVTLSASYFFSEVDN